MGIVQKDALRLSIVKYVGLALGYLNRAVLFILLFSVEEIGIINLLVSLGLLFGALAGFGSGNVIWKFHAYYSAKKELKAALLKFSLRLAVIGTLFFTCVYLFLQKEMIAYFAKSSEDFVKYYEYTLLIGVPLGFYAIFDYFLKSEKRNVISDFYREFVIKASTTVLLAFYYFDLLHFESFILCMSLLYWIPLVFLSRKVISLVSWKSFGLRVKVKRKMKKVIYEYALFIYVNSVSAIFITSIDAIMIGSMMGLFEVGVYTTAIYLTGALMIPYRSLIQIAAPQVALLWKEKSSDGLSKLYKQISGIGLFLGLFMWIFMFGLGESGFQLLPSEFEQGYWIALIIMTGKLVDSCFGVNGTILVTSKKFKVDLFFTLLLLLLVILLNSLFIPQYGMYGAAWATTIAVVIYNLSRFVYLWRVFKLQPFGISQAKIMLIASIVVTLLYFFKSNSGTFLLDVAINSFMILLFPIGVYLTNANEDIVAYANKVLRKIGIIK